MQLMSWLTCTTLSINVERENNVLFGLVPKNGFGSNGKFHAPKSETTATALEIAKYG
jgi:hypothetical protein